MTHNPTGNVARDEAEARQGLIATTPLSVPWIEPEDVAPVVVFWRPTRRGWSRERATR